jgi:pyridoxine 5-phosphate synthase
VSTVRLGVNIDHAATVRQARYRDDHLSPHAEPKLVTIAQAALAGGADGITVHLREDRRHLQDSDLADLLSLTNCRINLELACTDEMVAIALRSKPAAACLVPESRQEITTEGGLNIVGHFERVRKTVSALTGAGIEVSLFIDADPRQIEAAVAVGAPVIELHTGAWARAHGVDTEASQREFERLKAGCIQAHRLGLIVNAGHGINYLNAKIARQLPHIHELNIGHSIVARALFVGIQSAVAEMRSALS